MFYNHLFGIKKLTYIRPSQISIQTYANTEKNQFNDFYVFVRIDWYGLFCYGKNSAKQLIWLIENDKIVILALTQVLSVTIWAGKYWSINYLKLFKLVFVVCCWLLCVAACFPVRKLNSRMKLQICINISEISTESSVAQRKIGSSRLWNTLKLSSKHAKLHNGMHL